MTRSHSSGGWGLSHPGARPDCRNISPKGVCVGMKGARSTREGRRAQPLPSCLMQWAPLSAWERGQ